MPDRKMISENELNRSLFKVVSMIEHLHEHVGKDLSYQQMTKDAMELSGCRYAAMNLFEPDSPGFRTVAIAGDRKVAAQGVPGLNEIPDSDQTQRTGNGAKPRPDTAVLP